MQYLIGVDLGTSGTKTVLFDEAGTVVASAVQELKKQGIFIFAADMDGEQTLYEADFTLPCALVIGSEGEGISSLVKKECDYVVRIPQKGKIPSLNASNAAAVLLYEALRKRL